MVWLGANSEGLNLGANETTEKFPIRLPQMLRRVLLTGSLSELQEAGNVKGGKGVVPGRYPLSGATLPDDTRKLLVVRRRIAV